MLNLIRRFLCAVFLCACVHTAYADRTVKHLGDFMQVMVPVYALGMAMHEHDWTGVEQFVYSFATTEAIVYGLKFGVQEQRPDGSDNLSFPSGHTAATMSGASFIHNRYGIKRAIFPYLMTGFTAYSRIDANKHWWWDTLAGATISSLVSLVFVDRYRGVRILTHPTGVRFAVKF